MLASVQYMSWEELLNPAILIVMAGALLAILLTLKSPYHWTNWIVRINSVLFLFAMLSGPLYRSGILKIRPNNLPLEWAVGIGVFALFITTAFLVKKFLKNVWDKWFLIILLATEASVAIMFKIEPDPLTVMIPFLCPAVIAGFLAILNGKRSRLMWSLAVYPIFLITVINGMLLMFFLNP